MGKRGPAPTHPCGTRAAFRRHERNGEKPCQPCIEANRNETAAMMRKLRAETPDERAAREEAAADARIERKLKAAQHKVEMPERVAEGVRKSAETRRTPTVTGVVGAIAAGCTTVEQIAAHTGISRWTLYHQMRAMARRGEIVKAHPVGFGGQTGSHPAEWRLP